MATNRLAALQNATPIAPPIVSTATTTAANTAVVVVDDEDPLQKGLALVNDIHTKLRDLEYKTVQVDIKGTTVQRSVDPATDGSLHALQIAMDEANRTAATIKRALDGLKKHIEEYEVKPDASRESIIILEHQLKHCTRHFVAAMMEYNATVRRNEKAMVAQVKQRISLVYSTDIGCVKTDGELQEMAEKYVSDTVDGWDVASKANAKTELTIGLENRQDYAKMSRSMKELSQIYSDLAVLLGEQSGLIDQIDGNFERANEEVEHGIKTLKEVRPVVRSTRRCSLWLFVIIAVIFFIILAVVLGLTI